MENKIEVDLLTLQTFIKNAILDHFIENIKEDAINEKINSLLFACEYKYESRLKKLEQKLENICVNQDALFQRIVDLEKRIINGN